MSTDASGRDWDSWSHDERREIKLVLMADALSTIAYGTVDWTRVAELGRAIVAIAEQRKPDLVGRR
jgi:hypothetical protein